MKSRIKCCSKLLLAITLPLVIVCYGARSAPLQDFWFNVESLVVGTFGSSAQLQVLVDKAHRMAAARRGDLETYELGKAYETALRAMRDMERKNPRWSDMLIESVQQERAERHGEQTLAPHSAPPSCDRQ